MKLNLILLISSLIFFGFSCDDTDDVAETGLLENLLRVEVRLSIDQCDFTRSNGQVTMDIKELLYVTFDSRNGERVLNSSNDELTVNIDYTSIIGTIHNGSFITRLYKTGNNHFVDFDCTKTENAGAIETKYAFRVYGIEESSDIIIDDVTKTRELSFELSGLDVCSFLDAAIDIISYPQNPTYSWDSDLVDDILKAQDCMSQSQLLIKFVYDEN